MSSMFGARPAATRTFSTSTSCFFPAISTLNLTEVLADLHVADLCTREHRDSALLERLGELDAHVVILDRQKLLRDFYDRDLRSERREHVCELAADGAGADDRHRLRRLLEGERFIGRNHARLVQLEPSLRQALHS